MLTERQNQILKTIILEYIKLAYPVGSHLICKSLLCSSATVRSEMAVLEDLGLLEKTHTSSGRIPSEAGYRYYVDYLMEPKEMSGEDMLKVQIAFRNQGLHLSDSLQTSLEIISEMTSYTSIVLGKTSHDNKLKEISVVPLSDTSMIIIVITDRGHVEHKNLDLPNVSLEEVKKTVNLINDLIVGTPIDEISSKLEFEIKPIIPRYVKEHEFLYNAFYNVFRDFTSKNVNIVGKNHILEQPEFKNIDKIKELFSKMEEKHLIDKIETTDKNIRIYIGTENNIDNDVAVIQTTYKTPTDEGVIAIVGPKRMDYSRVVSLLEYMNKHTLTQEKGENDE